MVVVVSIAIGRVVVALVVVRHRDFVGQSKIMYFGTFCFLKLNLFLSLYCGIAQNRMTDKFDLGQGQV